MTFVTAAPYVPKQKNLSRLSGIRIVTAAGLFDGHDAAINILA